MKKTPAKRRIFELDLLRGIFIVIILIDHLQFWPSPLKFLTGEGRLWVSAAEGFFLISGLLVGYIRGYKSRRQPLKDITKKLLARAGMLYLWGVGITLFIIAFTLAVGGPSVHPLLPKLPEASQMANPFVLLWNVLSANYFSDWIYFLRLYAIMLAVTPLFLWLLRRGQQLVIIAGIIALYVISFWWKEGALQWQVLFFGAALLGYYLEPIAIWFGARPRVKHLFTWSVATLTIATMAISYFFVLGWPFVERPDPLIMTRDQYISTRVHLDPYFTSNPMALGRIALSFLWFGGILMFLHTFRDFIIKWFGWILVFFGERSLSGYILQAVLLPFIVIFIPHSDSRLYNTIIALVFVMGVWALLRTKLAARIIPR